MSGAAAGCRRRSVVVRADGGNGSDKCKQLSAPTLESAMRYEVAVSNDVAWGSNRACYTFMLGGCDRPGPGASVEAPRRMAAMDCTLLRRIDREVRGDAGRPY